MIVGSGIAALFYFRDHAGSHFGGVIAWLLILPVLLALGALVRVQPMRRPDVVILALTGGGTEAVESAVRIMQQVFVRNENVRRTKERAETISVVLFVGLLLLDAVWPWLVLAYAALGHLVGHLVGEVV